MQPNTQASLAPGRDDIRHLEADQEFCGVIGGFRLTTQNPMGNRLLDCSRLITVGGRRLLTRLRSSVNDTVSLV